MAQVANTVEEHERVVLRLRGGHIEPVWVLLLDQERSILEKVWCAFFRIASATSYSSASKEYLAER